MHNSVLPKRYAKALTGFCKTPQEIKLACLSLKDILILWDASEDFRLFVNNPILSTLERESLLEKMFKNKIPLNLLHFLIFISHKGRLALLPFIAKEFIEIYYNAHNILPAKVTSSVELTAHQISDLTQHLKLRFRKDIEVTLEVDPVLIGGIRIQIYDQVFDHTLKTQLERFYNSIIHA